MMRNAKHRGFTILELIIVVAVISIAAALAVPKLGDWTAEQDLNNTARELAADLRLLQQLSINSAGPTPELYLRIASPYGYMTTVNTKAIQPKRTFPATVKLSGAATTVSFTINGIPKQGTDMTIVLARTDGKGTKRIIVQAQTGRIRIE
ncbi:prepilin-type N-terminal cleavage/methylation domain-containing protein [Anaerospora hongkongensis]|uniref:prepilin-type N-terminal cleavage/methylation domain-containing protein n=1 Tax=Anaerospora hongkongensis TaxID=244830 RepID=UPI0028A24FBA|nr:prepilin-type N-terminal cleavage/methylation domain-containing protein [Anaerospora hongkongensis]